MEFEKKIQRKQFRLFIFFVVAMHQ